MSDPVRGRVARWSPFLTGSGSRHMSPHIRAVYAPQVPVDAAFGIQANLQTLKDSVESAVGPPAVPATANRY